MASESSDDAGVSVTLPADVEAWLDRKAADLGVDREAVVVQLLASYRAAEEFGDEDVAGALNADVEDEVRDVIAERLPDIAEAVAERVDGGGGDLDAVEEGLSAEIDRVESEFTDKIQDVRDRVVQVKREADDKADGDHTHPEFGELATLSTAVDDLESSLSTLESRVDEATEDAAATEERVDALDDRVSEIERATDRLDEVEERLQTVAWVVSDLREAEQARSTGTDAIDRLKATAAELDVDRAVCEHCSQAVDIALLHEPNCPHCDATVSDVALPGGLFGKPKLTVARKLEAGDESDRSNVPDAADGS
jgi:methyl-accepting chemotaxis protein